MNNKKDEFYVICGNEEDHAKAEFLELGYVTGGADYIIAPDRSGQMCCWDTFKIQHGVDTAWLTRAHKTPVKKVSVSEAMPASTGVRWGDIPYGEYVAEVDIWGPTGAVRVYRRYGDQTARNPKAWLERAKIEAAHAGVRLWVNEKVIMALPTTPDALLPALNPETLDKVLRADCSAPVTAFVPELPGDVLAHDGQGGNRREYVLNGKYFRLPVKSLGWVATDVVAGGRRATVDARAARRVPGGWEVEFCKK